MKTAAVLAAGALAIASPALAQAPDQAGIEQRLGESVPLEARFQEESGRTVHLGEIFTGRPVLLAFVYYQCPMLCNLVTDGVVRSLRALELDPGRDFEVVFVSIDPEDGPEASRSRKEEVLGRFGRAGSRAGWHFLTGDPASIRALADAVGFRYAFDPATRQFIHAAAIMVVTPDGRVSRYFYGVEYAPRDLRLGLVEASSGEIGTPLDQALLLCFQYDPATGRYTLAVLGVLRALGTLTVLALGTGIALAVRRERRSGRGGR